jgi:hypothetical protein
MGRSHMTAAMVGIALSALGIIQDYRVAAQQRAEARDMQLVRAPHRVKPVHALDRIGELRQRASRRKTVSPPAIGDVIPVT